MMDDFEVGDVGYIKYQQAESVCGEELFKVRIIMMKKPPSCFLMTMNEYDNLIGKEFKGDIRNLYKTMNQAIDDMIIELNSHRN